MGTQQFSLKWKNHQRNMLTTFERLLSNETLVDVTLACEGLSLKAHKMILSASSPFFQSLFQENPCKHPIVIMKDIKFAHLKAIVEFVYRGEVSVPQDQLTTLLKTAETLKVKGLADLSDDDWQTTDQENEKYYFTPMACDTQTHMPSPNGSNISDNEEGQEQSFPSIITPDHSQDETLLSCELSVNQSQAVSSYHEFGGYSCSPFQQDGKINNHKSTKQLSIENSPGTPSADLNVQLPAVPSKLIKQDSGSYNNQALLPHLVGLLSLPHTQGDQSFPSTSAYGSTVKEESDDSYLDIHDSSSLLSQNASSRNNVLGENSLVDGQKNDNWKPTKKTTNSSQSAAERPYACSVCNRRFTQKSNLQMHLQTHTGDKPNQCEICGTRFTRSRDLARHHLIHTGERPFACGTCGKKFNRNSHVRRHERLVHRKVTTVEPVKLKQETIQ